MNHPIFYVSSQFVTTHVRLLDRSFGRVSMQHSTWVEGILLTALVWCYNVILLARWLVHTDLNHNQSDHIANRSQLENVPRYFQWKISSVTHILRLWYMMPKQISFLWLLFTTLDYCKCCILSFFWFIYFLYCDAI